MSRNLRNNLIIKIIMNHFAKDSLTIDSAILITSKDF